MSNWSHVVTITAGSIAALRDQVIREIEAKTQTGHSVVSEAYTAGDSFTATITFTRAA